MKINPHLCFEGRAEEALDFYQAALSAEITMMMCFGDMPNPSECEPKLLDKVMHATVTAGDSIFMVSDGHATGEADFKGITLSLLADSIEHAHEVFNQLADGGEVTMPLDKMFWSPAFGMLIDRFGVSWMVNVDAPQSQI